MSSKHTQTPWSVGLKVPSAIYGPSYEPICLCDGMGETESDNNNAGFIVRAVNSHYQLVAALEELHALVLGEARCLLDEDSGGTERLDADIRAALAAAGAA